MATGAAQAGAYVRPRFFAGQLLCEEDLESLVAYTAAKDRLHNRYLVGTGVVNGLDVTCLPGQPGRVLLHAGYALDCCGNDIVVPCDLTVDVTALVADLPGGGNCGEAIAPSLPRTFDLVIEYAETPTALLSPYSTGDSATGTCEPSRIQEGYQVSLRCPPGEPAVAPGSLATALRCCLQLTGGDPQVARLERAAGLIDRIVAAPSEPDPGVPAEADVKKAIGDFEAQPTLERGVRLASLAAGIALHAAGQSVSAATPVGTGQAVGSTQPVLPQPNPPMARQALETVVKLLPHLRTQAGNDPLTTAETDSLGERSEALLGHLGTNVAPGPEDQLLARGLPVSERLRVAIRDVIAAMRTWTVCAGQPDAAHNCGQQLELARLSADPGDDVSLKRAAALALAAARRAMLDCACSAVNPPVPACDDDAVRLARLTVEGCDVINICTSVRRYSVTGTALRHWLPVDQLTAFIEQRCCSSADPADTLQLLRSILDRSWLRDWLGAETRAGGTGAQLAAREEELTRRAEVLAFREAQLTDTKRVGKLGTQLKDLSARLVKLEAQIAPGGQQ